jgi:hypothetical protein
MINQEKVKKTEEPVALIGEGWSKFERKINVDEKTPEGFVEIGRGMVWRHDIGSSQNKCPKTMQKFLCKA